MSASSCTLAFLLPSFFLIPLITSFVSLRKHKWICTISANNYENVNPNPKWSIYAYAGLLRRRSQISAFLAQSGPMRRSLVARSTRGWTTIVIWWQQLSMPLLLQIDWLFTRLCRRHHHQQPMPLPISTLRSSSRFRSFHLRVSRALQSPSTVSLPNFSALSKFRSLSPPATCRSPTWISNYFRHSLSFIYFLILLTVS